jgi:hypothetical protein
LAFSFETLPRLEQVSNFGFQSLVSLL